MATVVALLPDLLFGSKVAAMLGEAGHEVVSVSQPGDVGAQAARAEVLVVDLTQEAAERVGTIEALRGDRPVLAFYLHTDTDTKARAEAAGFDLVVPRSRMAREGADLVGRLAG